MKKIVSAVAIAAVVASMATAEVKTSINARLGSNLVQKTSKGEKSGASDSTKLMDLDGVTTTDAFTFKASNDFAGITLNYNPSLNGNTANTAKNFWANGNGVEYTAFVNPADWLQLKFGAHKDGIFYAEQVKKDTDDTAWSAAGKYAFLNKPGIVTKNSTGYFLDSLTDIANGGQLFGLLDFKASDIGGGNLLVRLTAVNTYDGVNTTSTSTTTYSVYGFGDGTTDAKKDTYYTLDKGTYTAVTAGEKLNKETTYYTASKTTTKTAVGEYNWFQKKDSSSDDAYMNAAPGLMVAWKNEAVNVNLDFQMPTSKDIAAGLYVSPLGLADNALQLMVGGTISKNLSNEDDQLGLYGSFTGTDSDGNKTYAAGALFYGVDLRLRYVAGDFHIANAFNLTGATEEGLVKPAGSLSGQTGDMNIWDAIFATYKLNDNVTITGNVQVNATTGVYNKNKDANDKTWLDLYVTPGVMYTVGKGATITAGLHMSFADLTGVDSDAAALSTKTTIAVPVITRIKL